MDDLISRQVAIDAVKEYFKFSPLEGRQCAKAIERVPTVQPRKGKWMPHNEKSREYIGTVLVNVEYDYWLCDTCGYRVEKRQPMYNFCPNCGADMRGEQDE